MCCRWFAPSLFLALAAVGVRGGEPATPLDPAALEDRVAQLEQQLAEVVKELKDIRRELMPQALTKSAPMTPAQAVEAFQQDPKKPVTVEFGVESAGWPDGPVSIDDDPLPPIMADWDGRLPNGGKFSLLLAPNAIRGLGDLGIDLPPAQPAGLFDMQRISALCKHLKGKGVRATGLIRASRLGEKHTDYYIVVDDPAHFSINR